MFQCNVIRWNVVIRCSDVAAASDKSLIAVRFYYAVNDTLDDILNDSADDEEEQAIVNKVLDEIGIEISGKVSRL